MQIATGVIGYDRIGKRIADAISRQPDLRLAGVYETDFQRIKVIRARELPLADGELCDWAGSCDVVVVCQENVPALSSPTVYSPEIHRVCPLFPSTNPPPGAKQLRVACGDALAILRLIVHLPAVVRIFSSCARRAGHATDHRFARVDALEPLFECPTEDADLQNLLASRVRDVFVRRTRLPYTHSHLHHLKLDLAGPITREAVLAALHRAPRVRLAQGAKCFPDTGRLQEYYRDLGWPRGDRTEVFVWEETVTVVEQTVFLTADVNPDATPVPEIVDAVRCLARPDLSTAEVSQITDHALESRR